MLSYQRMLLHRLADCFGSSSLFSIHVSYDDCCGIIVFWECLKEVNRLN